jgi:hypothetical protein
MDTELKSVHCLSDGQRRVNKTNTITVSSKQNITLRVGDFNNDHKLDIGVINYLTRKPFEVIKRF